ncbi:MAG: hypothetical protein V3R34_01780 [Hyphomicrobium sp.]
MGKNRNTRNANRFAAALARKSERHADEVAEQKVFREQLVAMLASVVCEDCMCALQGLLGVTDEDVATTMETTEEAGDEKAQAWATAAADRHLRETVKP